MTGSACPPRRDDGGHGARAPLPTLRYLTHTAKLLGRLVEHEQRALGDAEIGTVQLELAACDEGTDEGKRHQVLQAANHRGLLDPDREIGHRLMVALRHGLA